MTFKFIPDYPGYRVCDDGSVWSNKIGGKWRMKLPGTLPSGHKYVFLHNEHGPKSHLIHRLVLCVFKGPCPDGMEGCHNDGNPANNDISNLRWDTRQANCADAIKHGTFPRGSRKKSAKLNEADVEEIRSRLAYGEMQKDLATRFGAIENRHPSDCCRFWLVATQTASVASKRKNRKAPHGGKCSVEQEPQRERGRCASRELR